MTYTTAKPTARHIELNNEHLLTFHAAACMAYDRLPDNARNAIQYIVLSCDYMSSTFNAPYAIAIDQILRNCDISSGDRVLICAVASDIHNHGYRDTAARWPHWPVTCDNPNDCAIGYGATGAASIGAPAKLPDELTATERAKLDAITF